MSARASRGLALALALTACRPADSPQAPTAKLAVVAACHYEVVVTEAPVAVEVDASCTGRGLSAFQAEPEIVPFVEVRGEGYERLAPRFVAREPADELRIRYRIDLEAAGDAVDDFDLALHLSGGVVAPASTWLLRPHPTPAGEPVTLRVRTNGTAGFATALPLVDGLYRLETHELRVATYAIFGRFQSTTIRVPGPGSLGPNALAPRAASTLEVARLSAPLALSNDELVAWIRDTANEVAKFWHGFPVEHALAIVVPIRGREGVVFGKVLPAGGPGITLLVGARTPKDLLYDHDWVLTHELFHLGFPSFIGEGKWLDEGLATYYEPIIRVRAGWMTEEELWKDFVDSMPRGLRALEKDGLEHTRGYGAVYWGGAIACLAADVNARRASGGALALEHGIRAVRERGGTAQHVWSLADTIAVADEAMAGPFLGKLALAHADRGAPFSLDNLLRELGVERTMDGVILHDTAPLAGIRRAIATAPSATTSIRLPD